MFNHQFLPRQFLSCTLSVHCLRTIRGLSKYLYLAIWWAICWQLLKQVEMNQICHQMVFDQNYATWISVSFFWQYVIGREDCRNIGAIATSSSSSSRLGNQEGSFSLFFSLISFSFVVYFFCLPYLLAYLNGHPSCVGWGEGSLNAFAIFVFLAQFKSGTDESDKLKTPKFISKSLFTSLV